MLRQQEMQNLLNVLSRATFNGMEEAMVGVTLHARLSQLIQQANLEAARALVESADLGDSQDNS